jgi:hypothetical protein
VPRLREGLLRAALRVADRAVQEIRLRRHRIDGWHRVAVFVDHR